MKMNPPSNKSCSVLYMFHLLQKFKMFNKIPNKGTINVFQEGGGVQRSMIKDHIFTLFFTLPLVIF